MSGFVQQVVTGVQDAIDAARVNWWIAEAKLTPNHCTVTVHRRGDPIYVLIDYRVPSELRQQAAMVETRNALRGSGG